MLADCGLSLISPPQPSGRSSTTQVVPRRRVVPLKGEPAVQSAVTCGPFADWRGRQPRVGSMRVEMPYPAGGEGGKLCAGSLGGLWATLLDPVE